MKLSQNGKHVRFDLAAVWFKILSPRTSQLKGGSGKIHKMRPKGLNQVKLGPTTVTNQRVKAQTNLRSDVQLVINVPEQRRLETSQSQADRPR